MTFSYTDYKDSVLEFAQKVPELLLRHPSTAPLALKISELNLAAALTSRFTVAIIGQMRSGKSTLLNALIGQRLAPVGINETTATINCFRHGKDGECGKFRVHWDDDSTEDLPLTEVEAWVGRSENARRTKVLDFFASSDFLASANIVDTPGTRSTIEEHEDATITYLAEKLQEVTLREGGQADAVIYVVNPVARKDDAELLRWFGDRTRLPGASAINSIAVVQKWEHLRPDPLNKIEEMCDRMRGQFAGKVSEVLPVSGILALYAVEVSDLVWQQVVQLAVESKPDVFEDLVLSDEYFLDEQPEAPLDRVQRKALLAQLPWPVLSFALWLARRNKPGSGLELRSSLLAVSNIDRLKWVLRSRFFDLASLIKAGTALRKAWEPCRIGMLTFRDQIERKRDIQALGMRALDALEQADSSSLEPAREYIRRSRDGAEHEIKHLSEAHRQLDEMFHREERTFRLLDTDMEQLRALDADDSLLGAERQELQALFGQQGPEVRKRLGLADNVARDEALDRAGQRHGFWKTREMRAQGNQRKVFAHAVERLETILDHLEVDA